MNHLPWMLERGAATGISEPCGHALMASCPPEPFSELSPEIPFGHHHQHQHSQGVHQGGHQHPNPPSNGNGSNNVGGGDAGAATWTLSKADLTTLLDLSKRLNLDGEITPVMAWGMVLAHPRLGELGQEDFGRLAEELRGKVRCYGYVTFLFFLGFCAFFPCLCPLFLLSSVAFVLSFYSVELEGWSGDWSTVHALVGSRLLFLPPAPFPVFPACPSTMGCVSC